MRGEARFLEGVRERIVADVVQQRREPQCHAVALGDLGEFAALLERGERQAREVVGAERVLEAGVGGAGIDEEGVAELADVAQALHRRGVEHRQRGLVEADVVPEGIADDLEVARSQSSSRSSARRQCSGDRHRLERISSRINMNSFGSRS